MKKLAFVLLTSLATSSFAHNLQFNTALPYVSVQTDGEVIINNGSINYKNWESPALAGKVRVLQHMAGRSSVKEKNDSLMEMIKSQRFDASKYQTTTIINAEDAIFGTGAFVKSSAEKGKKNNPHSQVILDQTGQVKKDWGLQPKESLIVVLDKSGKVKFAHEGKLSEQQMNQVIELIKNLVQ